LWFMLPSPILLLSPHPDDVELGCAGTLSRLNRSTGGSLELIWITFSRAEKSVPQGYDIVAEHRNAVSLFSVKYHEILSFPVREFHKYRQEILEYLVEIKRRFKPATVFTPSRYDLHQDHQVVTSEAIRAFKNTSTILGYELPWNTLSFTPTLCVRLQPEDVEFKWRVLQFYKSQIGMRKYFDKDFIYGLARSRGIMCDAEYAECFEVIKWIL